jgi:hypothetical protein
VTNAARAYSRKFGFEPREKIVGRRHCPPRGVRAITAAKASMPAGAPQRQNRRDGTAFDRGALQRNV